jgi:hypothetical protein
VASASSPRHTNRARDQAFIGKERSLPLKLDRRMIATAVRQAGTRKVSTAFTRLFRTYTLPRYVVGT